MRVRIAFALAGIVFSGILPAVGQSVPLLEKKTVGLAAAKKMVAAAEAEAVKNNWKLSIAVVDDSGNLVYYEHMDGAGTVTIALSQGKARTAAALGIPSKALDDGLAKGNFQVLSLGLTPLRGGLPIIVDGKTVGGIAASGAKSEEDEQCAQAGIDALMK